LFATSVVDTSGNLPPTSTTPEVQVAKFAASVIDTGGVHSLVIISELKWLK
jgi:hypothetical protein